MFAWIALIVAGAALQPVKKKSLPPMLTQAVLTAAMMAVAMMMLPLINGQGFIGGPTLQLKHVESVHPKLLCIVIFVMCQIYSSPITSHTTKVSCFVLKVSLKDTSSRLQLPVLRPEVRFCSKGPTRSRRKPKTWEKGEHIYSILYIYIYMYIYMYTCYTTILYQCIYIYIFVDGLSLSVLATGKNGFEWFCATLVVHFFLEMQLRNWAMLPKTNAPTKRSDKHVCMGVSFKCREDSWKFHLRPYCISCKTRCFHEWGALWKPVSSTRHRW